MHVSWSNYFQIEPLTKTCTTSTGMTLDGSLDGFFLLTFRLGTQRLRRIRDFLCGNQARDSFTPKVHGFCGWKITVESTFQNKETSLKMKFVGSQWLIPKKWLTIGSNRWRCAAWWEISARIVCTPSPAWTLVMGLFCDLITDQSVVRFL